MVLTGAGVLGGVVCDFAGVAGVTVGVVGVVVAGVAACVAGAGRGGSTVIETVVVALRPVLSLATRLRGCTPISLYTGTQFAVPVGPTIIVDVLTPLKPSHTLYAGSINPVEFAVNENVLSALTLVPGESLVMDTVVIGKMVMTVDTLAVFPY